MGYRVVDTTADTGIEAWGESLKELFEETARGLLYLMADLSKVDPVEEVEAEVEGVDYEDTLVTMLNEIIYLHETRKMLFSDIEILDLSPGRVRFRLRGEKIDLRKHELNTEVKAATYHNIRIAKEGDTYRVRVVFDL